MPILKNSRHEKFVQFVANGKSAAVAYVCAGYENIGAKQNASRLMTNDDVKARIAELMSRAEDKADITRGEIIKILANYARSHPDNYTHDVRLKAIQQLCKMTGWDAADKVELSVDNELTELLMRLRGGG